LHILTTPQISRIVFDELPNEIKTICVDYPNDWPYVNLYALADLHDGDERAYVQYSFAMVDIIKNDPYGLCALNGDLFNIATRISVSDIYSETMPPSKQLDAGAKLFKPIAHKIIGVDDGNHESRIYKAVGMDITRLLCRELGIEDRYNPSGLLMFLRFGTNKERNSHYGKQWYSIYMTHGRGGGSTSGGKINRLVKLQSIVDADAYIHSHTHESIIRDGSGFRVSPITGSIKRVQKVFINTGSPMLYGGYAQDMCMQPGSMSTPVLTCYAERKFMTATS
jgi:hypothetical protein